MSITYYPDLLQGSDEWFAARCGLLTASEIKHILTPTLKPAANEKTRAHMWELAAQRVTRYVEPAYIGDDQMRGYDDEIRARELYVEKIAPVRTMGFVTNDRWGFTLGYSPDGLVGDDGLIECKSRRQRFQIETIVEDIVPADFWFQCQAALLISERAWLDFISYSGGMPMTLIRAHPDPDTHAAIIEAAAKFEAEVALLMERYQERVAGSPRHIPTERVDSQEMMV